MIISATDLSSYLFCPRKLYARKVLKIRDPVNRAMTEGTIRHHTHDTLARKQQERLSNIQEGMNDKDIKQLFRNDYLHALKDAVTKNQKQLKETNTGTEEVIIKAWNFLQYMADSEGMQALQVAKTHNAWGENIWQHITPKHISEKRFDSKELGLKGIVDLIEVYPDKHVPVELKTGKAPTWGVWAGHKLQIATYQLLLSEHLQQPIIEGCVRYLDHQADRKVLMNELLKKEVFKIRDKVIALLESPIMPAPCTKSICACEDIIQEQSTLHNL